MTESGTKGGSQRDQQGSELGSFSLPRGLLKSFNCIRCLEYHSQTDVVSGRAFDCTDRCGCWNCWGAKRRGRETN